MELKESVTLQNLMRAFTGECQARSRYAMARECAEREGLHNVAALFRYIAHQEQEHAQVLHGYLRSAGADNVEIRGGYPVDLGTDTRSLLRAAVKYELDEVNTVYPAFARKAAEEGFRDIEQRFSLLAAIEQTHADRLGQFLSLMEQGKLFRDDGSLQWVCLNCGHLLTGPEAPGVCPVCSHAQGYFVRAAMAPFS